MHPDSPGFDETSLPHGVSVEAIRDARAYMQRVFHPSNLELVTDNRHPGTSTIGTLQFGAITLWEEFRQIPPTEALATAIAGVEDPLHVGYRSRVRDVQGRV
jgi:hypothetical protein